jgi:hypothetical protein
VQALANIIDLFANSLIQVFQLRLQLLHPGKSAAELGIELRILRLEVGLLHPQGLQGRARNNRGDQFRIPGTRQAVTSLFNNPISLSVRQLRIQVA